MSRHIIVIKPEDPADSANLPSVDGPTSHFEKRLAEGMARWLYDAPLGSEDRVRLYWSEPAEAQGLPLLASIYEQGFQEGIEWSGEQLDEVMSELAVLKAYWLSLPLDDDLLSDLQKRAGFLERAIEVAREAGAVVTIA